MQDIRQKLKRHRHDREEEQENPTKRLQTVSDEGARYVEPPPSQYKYVLKISIWMFFGVVSYYLSLLIPFLIVMCLAFMYTKGTSNSKKRSKSNRMSAYSVFNPGFKEIQGTLNAEKLQKEMTALI